MHIPKIVCVKCKAEMVPVKNDIQLEAFPARGKFSYYKVNADKWKCPICNFEVYTGFGQKPFAEKYEDGYDEIKCNDTFNLN